jgi:RNA polymerase sigma-70 factor (ECF subfamily)
VKVCELGDSKYRMLPVPVSEAALAGPPDAVLIHRCVAGDEQAWRELYRSHYAAAAAFLRKLGVRERELDDATQEVFTQLFRSLPQFRGEAQLRTWLYRLCATQARRARRFRAVSNALSALFGQDADATTRQELPADLARERVSAALDRLNEGERLVFVLYELEGLSGDDVANIAGCPVATVWRRLHYARARFRGAIEAEAAS